MADYLLSVVIPTRNNPNCARLAVENIIENSDERVQVVVQDNGDNDELSMMLSGVPNAHRLKYNYSPHRLSVIDNFAMGLGLADGEYVCMIGDDDGVSHYLADFAEWAAKNEIDALKPRSGAYYTWPGTYGNRLAGGNGRLVIRRGSCRLRKCDTISGVMRLSQAGGQGFAQKDIVKVYHGLVRKSFLEKVKERSGKYFGGLSPDIYIGTAASLLGPKMVEIDCPLVIAGSCRNSATAKSNTGAHTGDLSSAPHFAGQSSYQWSPEVPPLYSVETIWADTFLHAVRDHGSAKLLDSFGVEALESLLLARYGRNEAYASLILAHYSSRYPGQSHAERWFRLAAQSGLRVIGRFAFFGTAAIRRLEASRIVYRDVIDINRAQALLDKALEAPIAIFMGKDAKI